MKILAIDPSLSRTGFCWIDLEAKKVDVQYQTFNSFKNKYLVETSRLMNSLLEKVQPEIIVIEEPLPQSYYAGYLWGLFTSFLRDIVSVKQKYPQIGQTVAYVNPSSHKSFQAFGKRGKSYVTKKAKKVLNLFQITPNLNPPLWVTDNQKQRRDITHDESDAFFLILFYLSSFKGAFSTEVQSQWLFPTRNLFKVNPDDISKFKEFKAQEVILNLAGV